MEDGRLILTETQTKGTHLVEQQPRQAPGPYHQGAYAVRRVPNPSAASEIDPGRPAVARTIASPMPLVASDKRPLAGKPSGSHQVISSLAILSPVIVK